MSEDLDLGAAMRVGARVAAMSDLRDVRLFEAHLQFNDFPGDADLTWELEIAPTTTYSEGDDFFILESEYSVRVETVEDDNAEDGDKEPTEDPGDGAPGEIVATVAFKLAGLYSLDVPKGRQGPTTSELDAYAKTMGAMALYPYAREFIQSSISRMGLPPLTLSTFRLPYPDTTVAPSLPEGDGTG